MKAYIEADILAVRWNNPEDGKIYYAVECQILETEGGSCIRIKSKELISGKHFRRIAQEMMLNAGYSAPTKYKDFLKTICGNFIDGSFEKAMAVLAA